MSDLEAGNLKADSQPGGDTQALTRWCAPTPLEGKST